LTYNIFHGETRNGDYDLEQIARVIREADPDLVALQEVDLYTGRSGHRDLAAELGLLTRLVPLFGRAMPFDGGEYGEAILSRYAFLSSRNHALPAGEGKEPRAALEVRVQLPGGDTIGFVGTHFDHTADEQRSMQAARVNDIFRHEHGPLLLAGDLNATPESPAMHELFMDWTAVSRDMAPTYPSLDNWDHALAEDSGEGPSIKIDYILYRPAERWRVQETRVICDPEASDHCALLAVLELLPERR
jgi:endonuclease/exonuclease/phosphatase family metal-dependent hydrolase